MAMWACGSKREFFFSLWGTHFLEAWIQERICKVGGGGFSPFCGNTCSLAHGANYDRPKCERVCRSIYIELKIKVIYFLSKKRWLFLKKIKYVLLVIRK